MGEELTSYSPPLKDILKRWDDAGLVPMDITPEQITQEIVIRHNPITGKANISYTRLDGIQAVGLSAMAMAQVWRDTFHSELAPRLNSGNAKVCIQLEGERLSVSFGMGGDDGKQVTADPVVACGMMASALFAVTMRVAGPDFDPMAALLQGLEFKLTKTTT
jgi:hypothetical protein